MSGALIGRARCSTPIFSEYFGNPLEEDVTASVAMAVFGLDGFRVLAAEVGGELELLVETAADLRGVDPDDHAHQMQTHPRGRGCSRWTLIFVSSDGSW